jgi:UDP-N-acetylmuramoyl-tripeptide--D-alanyl-D-alanine ligase
VKLEASLLSEAIEKARIYYLAQQLPAGNFVYGRDVTTNETAEDDNQVRQAGALWGLASLNRDRPTLPTARAVIRGLHFFLGNSRPVRMGPMAPIYPGAGEIKTGTVALVTLALVELWRGEEQYLTRIGRGMCSNWVTQYLTYLQAMQMDNGSWGRSYYVESGEREAVSSAYYDGEALLAYCRAARYVDHKELIPKIEKIAPMLVKKYTVDAWRADPDSDLTKGFFQWGCMAFAEYVEAGWKDADLMADACLSLAWWEIRMHKVEEARGNTGYAVEGLP